MNQHQVDARCLLKPAIYRAKAAEYEQLAATVEPAFREALLDVAQKWRAMADEADIRDNPNRAFAERLRRSLGLSC